MFFLVDILGWVQLVVGYYECLEQLPEIRRCICDLCRHLLSPLELDSTGVVSEGSRKHKVSYDCPRRIVVGHHDSNEGQESTKDQANQFVYKPIYEHEQGDNEN